ncbi:MAG: tetratricopeptide repeat protein [Pseudomonadota bacterium]
MAALVVVGVDGLRTSGVAQTSGNAVNAASGEDALRARQSALFDQLLAEPDNLDLMFDYALVSIQARDYEAAISTLERMLIYRQDLPRVRLELAVAYFNLGSYEVAKLYFEQVLANEATPETVQIRVDRYLDEIEDRSRRNDVRMIATAGITYATNATLGPDANQVLFLGNLETLSSGQQEADTGLRVTLNLAHAYDLGQANNDTWRTELGYYGVQYFDTDQGDLNFLRVRTGPKLSLDPRTFGPKLRPYGEAQYLTSQNRGLFAAFGGGVEFSDTLSPTVSVYSDVGVRFTNYFRGEFTDEDVFTYYAASGLAYLPRRDLILRSTLIFELDHAPGGQQNSNQEMGLRLSGEYSYDPGLNWVDGRWTASAYLEARGRLFERPDKEIDPGTTRHDIDLRGGLRHVFMIGDGFGLQVDVDGLWRQSNLRNFDVNNLSGTFSLRYEL